MDEFEKVLEAKAKMVAEDLWRRAEALEKRIEALEARHQSKETH